MPTHIPLFSAAKRVTYEIRHQSFVAPRFYRPSDSLELMVWTVQILQKLNSHLRNKSLNPQQYKIFKFSHLHMCAKSLTLPQLRPMAKLLLALQMPSTNREHTF